MYKAIITDLDGTLFNGESLISDYSAEVLRQAEKKGYTIIIATGRHHADAGYIVRNALGIKAYRISSNGGMIVSPEGRIIARHLIKEDLAEKLLSIEVPEKVYVHLYKGDKWYADKHDEGSVCHQALSGFMFETADLKNMSDYTDCSKICFIARDDEGIRFMNDTVEQFKDPRLSFFFTMARCFEAMDKNADKGMAVEQVLRLEGINRSQAVAFGDGMNDKSMLEYAGKGIIMGNAVEELKNALPYNEVTGPNTEDSVARYIEKHLL